MHVARQIQLGGSKEIESASEGKQRISNHSFGDFCYEALTVKECGKKKILKSLNNLMEHMKKINTLKWDFLPSTLQKLWLLRQTKCYYLAIWDHTSQESVKWYGVRSNDTKREVLCSQIVCRLYNNNNVKAKKKCLSTKLKLRIMVKDNRWSCTVQ